jgi:hypothetical protein
MPPAIMMVAHRLESSSMVLQATGSQWMPQTAVNLYTAQFSSN